MCGVLSENGRRRHTVPIPYITQQLASVPRIYILTHTQTPPPGLTSHPLPTPCTTQPTQAAPGRQRKPHFLLTLLPNNQRPPVPPLNRHTHTHTHTHAQTYIPTKCQTRVARAARAAMAAAPLNSSSASATTLQKPTASSCDQNTSPESFSSYVLPLSASP